MPEKSLIIGSGCAGLTAAIYAARANMAPLVITGLMPGGQLMLTTEIENFPGFVEPVSAQDLMDSMKKQCERLGVRFVNDVVEKVDFKSRPFGVWTSDNKKIETLSVIVAAGGQAKWLGLPSEAKFRGKGVSACAVCDGFFFKGKDLAVVGGGDSAMEEASFLTNFAKSVSVIHRRDKFRASPAMQERARKNPKIRFILDSVVEEILGTDSVAGIKVKNLKTNSSQTVACQGVFVAIGHEPATGFLKDQVDLDEWGYVKTLAGSFVRTSKEGVFAAGNCVDHRFRQAITAAALGAMAAMESRWFLEEKGLL